jgi:hypothetical protein
MNNESTLLPSLHPERSLRAQTDKDDLIESLLRTLDALIFLQLGVLYLCDNLTFLLILRAVSQVVHVQYRAPGTTQLAPAIFVNVLSAITHIILNQQHKPSGSDADATKTLVLHGGLIIDFVGELASSRWKLLLQDLVILGLQLFMLVVGYEKQIASGEEERQPQPPPPPPPQDIEAEEEGRRRSRDQERDQEEQQQSGETEQGIELTSLLPPERQRGDESGIGGSGVRRKRPPNASSTPPEDDDLIVVDMRRGLTALLRRPLPSTTAPTVEDPATRAGLANVLARIAAARARAAVG